MFFSLSPSLFSSFFDDEAIKEVPYDEDRDADGGGAIPLTVGWEMPCDGMRLGLFGVMMIGLFFTVKCIALVKLL